MGCAFVASRCSVQRHDYSVPVPGPSSCTGLDSWPDYSQLIERKCQWGSTVCADAYQAATSTCDAQCATGTDNGEAETCAANVTAARAAHVDHVHDGLGGGGGGGGWWWWLWWVAIVYLLVVALYASSGQVVAYYGVE